MGDVTRILSDIEGGDSGAAEQLLPLIYDELRRLAAQKMAGESPDHTLQATALVHEAYVRLVDVEDPQHWNGRGHFFAAAAEAMRRILVENARRKSNINRGGRHNRAFLNESLADPASNIPYDLLHLDEAIDNLESKEPEMAKLVKLRLFVGLSHEESAALMGISVRTVKRYWRFARAWMYEQLVDSE